MNTSSNITIMTVDSPSPIDGDSVFVHTQFSDKQTEEFILVSAPIVEEKHPNHRDILIMFSDAVSQEIIEEALAYFENRPDITQKLIQALV